MFPRGPALHKAVLRDPAGTQTLPILLFSILINPNDMPNSDNKDVLLDSINRFWNQAIQNETTRANFATYIFAATGAIEGFIIQKDFGQYTWVLSLMIIVLGMFGILITLKYYERMRLLMKVVGKLEDELTASGYTPVGKIFSDLDKAAKSVGMGKMRTNYFWIFLYVLLILLGIANFFIAAKSNCCCCC